MGLVILGVVVVVLGVVLRQFPDITGKLGSRALEMQFTRNVESGDAPRIRQIAMWVLIVVGAILIIAGFITE